MPHRHAKTIVSMVWIVEDNLIRNYKKKKRFEQYNKESYFHADDIDQIMKIEYPAMRAVLEINNHSSGITLSKFRLLFIKCDNDKYQKVWHLKRRPSADINLINFLLKLWKKIFSTISFDRIINIDETTLFLNAKNMKNWHSKEQDDVSVPVIFSQKRE